MTKHSLINSKTLRFFLPPVVLTVVVIGFVLINKQLQNNIYDNKLKLTSTESQNPVDEVNDGVYVDDKYGVKFNYPNDIFKYQKDPYEKGDYRNVYWDKLEEGNSFLGGNLAGGHIRLAINSDPKSREDNLNDFEHIYSSPVGVTISRTPTMEFETRKIRNLSTKGAVGMVYDDFIEYSYGTVHYFAAWKKGEDTFWLVVSTNNKDENDQYKKIFDDIVASFEFIEPSTSTN